MTNLILEDENRLAEQAAQAIRAAFDKYQQEFREITCRAKSRFEKRDWHGAQKDAVERLDLYKKVIQQIVGHEGEILGAQVKNPALWTKMKAEYSRSIASYADFELAETFFNSVTRRIFTTVGVDPLREFVDSDFETPPTRSTKPIYSTYPLADARYSLPEDPENSLKRTASLVEHIFADFPFTPAYSDAAGDARIAAHEIDHYLQSLWGSHNFDRIEMLQSVFYRGQEAFLIGRVCKRDRVAPLVLCLLNGAGGLPGEANGIYLDAVLLDEDEVSIVFSFTRSYFHVDIERPYELVYFLKSIMPLKRLAELYISIGYNKHGKTELYRNLLRHIEHSTDKFQIAPGAKGMVMQVFTMPSYDVVFKVIKDRVEPPKTATRQDVMERYDLVFKHDRAGRLVDAQEFEYLSFDRSRFSEDLLAELLELAPSIVTADEHCVVFKHLYVERRLVPLNLYIQGAGEEAARSAVLDYGKAIKDLAATNIFPGDVLLKNFGVTRHGRVVFYDYDELCLLTDCQFRHVPPAQNYEDEFSAEPWFYVGPLDIFPAEFRTFLGLAEPLRSIFEEAHGELFGVEFWRDMQNRHHAGEMVEIFPYPESKHLRR